MASIRLFGRGRNTVAAGGPALGAALIADALEGLTAASMSTTWRCRHSAGVSIGEGAVDFTAARSRSTVIRGKYTFEYVRSGATAYRAAITDADGATGARTAVALGADANDNVLDAAVDAEELESAGLEASDDVDELALEGDEDAAEGEDAEEGEDGGDDLEEVDGEFDAEAGDEGDEDEDEGDGSSEEEEPSAAVMVSAGSASASAWEKFSEHDACGVHAYAEPAVLAAGVRATGVVQPREAEEFDGVKLSAYSVTLKPKPADPNRLLARLARHLRDHGANTVVVTAFVDESQSGAQGGEDDAGAANGDGSAAGGGAGTRILRLRIELPHWTPADDPTADHSVSVDLFEFGEPVSVDVPEGAGRRTARSCADLALF